jgi:integrase
MPRRDFPFVQRFVDRHDVMRFYFRRSGYPSATLPAPYGSTAFIAAYEAARKGAPLPIGAGRSAPGTISALIAAYYDAHVFCCLKPSTQRVYKNILERFRAVHGHKSVAGLQAKHVRQIMNARQSTPDAANRLRTLISILMDFAVSIDLRPDNPTVGVKRFRRKSEGFATWSETDIEVFRAHWPLGSRERLAFELALGTAQRRGDLCRIGWQHVVKDAILVRQNKTGACVTIPILPELQEALKLTPRDRLTFINKSCGAGMTAPSLGNWFREAIRAAGLSDALSLHGLRKATARRLAEAGCTPHEIAAITGHKSLSEIERYTREAEKTRMAQSAVAKLALRTKEKGEP